MTGRIFVDTNVFVYGRDGSEPAKMERANEVLRSLWIEKSGRTSTQVCNEFYVTVTRELSPGIAEKDAWADIQALKAWKPVSIDMLCLERAKLVQERYGLSWWDCLVVSTASQTGCSTILSEEFNNGQEYLGILAKNPFADL